MLREENDPKWESGKVKPDDGMRDLGELFEEAPSVESYPEYHVKVKNIMDLNTIRKKVLVCVCVCVCACQRACKQREVARVLFCPHLVVVGLGLSLMAESPP